MIVYKYNIHHHIKGDFLCFQFYGQSCSRQTFTGFVGSQASTDVVDYQASVF